MARMSDHGVQCRQDLTLLIPEGWPRIARRFNTHTRWGREFRGAQVPKGRLKPCASHQLANHKERKAGNLGKGGSSSARGWGHFPDRRLLFVLSAFSVVERLRLVLSVPSVPSVPSVVKIFNRPKAMIQEHESTAGISDEETALEQGRFSVGYKL